jgi:hypothetical protein
VVDTWESLTNVGTFNAKIVYILETPKVWRDGWILSRELCAIRAKVYQKFINCPRYTFKGIFVDPTKKASRQGNCSQVPTFLSTSAQMLCSYHAIH